MFHENSDLAPQTADDIIARVIAWTYPKIILHAVAEISRKILGKFIQFFHFASFHLYNFSSHSIFILLPEQEKCMNEL